jgi:hypothetical protein
VEGPGEAALRPHGGAGAGGIRSRRGPPAPARGREPRAPGPAGRGGHPGRARLAAHGAAPGPGPRGGAPHRSRRRPPHPRAPHHRAPHHRLRRRLEGRGRRPAGPPRAPALSLGLGGGGPGAPAGPRRLARPARAQGRQGAGLAPRPQGLRRPLAAQDPAAVGAGRRPWRGSGGAREGVRRGGPHLGRRGLPQAAAGCLGGLDRARFGGAEAPRSRAEELLRALEAHRQKEGRP